ncbi:MAG: four helix bundle protein [Deltaproteobacteria bacterium]|nr:four helix bundle protein [Deltaproteobacteria bacterium]
MKDFRKLVVWQKAHVLALDVYRATSRFPKEERYGLTSQIRRSAVSVASNIAEGCGRSEADFGRFLQIAMGSASELEYQLLLASDLTWLEPKSYQALEDQTVEVKRMLTALMRKLKADR